MRSETLHFPSLDSTNQYAKTHCEFFDPNVLTVISADEQTSGRGRGKRLWKSPKGTGLLLTFCSFCPNNFPFLQNLGQILSYACIQLLDSLEIDAKIKWPNDILIDGKKVAGILCEIIKTKDKMFIANGIGLNVNTAKDQLARISPKATSLFAANGNSYDTAGIRRRLTFFYKKSLEVFLEQGFAPFAAGYKRALPYTPGENISFHDKDVIINGSYHSLSNDGSLYITLANNEIKKFLNVELI